MVLSIIQSKSNDVIHKIMNDTLNKCWAMTDNCFILKWFMFVSDEKEVVSTRQTNYLKSILIRLRSNYFGSHKTDII